MPEESLNPSPKVMGRPGLPIEDQGVIFGRLAILTKGSEEFRRVRRELAAKYDRTERAIDQLFDKRSEEFLKKYGRELVTATRP